MFIQSYMRSAVSIAVLALGMQAMPSAASEIPLPEEVFANIPSSAKTGAWWHWMGSYVTKDAIVKDLDWFREMGIGTVTIFGLADTCAPCSMKFGNSPVKEIVAFTPEWWALVKFACEEAEKRGIEVGVHNCPGYTSSGGEWIEPRLAMRELVFNVTNVEKQIHLNSRSIYALHNLKTGRADSPRIPSRRTDLQEIAVVDGIKVQHIPMGTFIHPAQPEAFGLECDKMNPEAVDLHLDRVIGDIKKYVGEQVGRGFKFVLLDSYEAGHPTWTPNMREEFIKRRGYDPLPFLPILGGFKVAAAPDKEAENKFRRDYSRTIADLYRDVLFKRMREKLNAAGLEFACEPYHGPFDTRECAAYVDRLMTEFWFNSNPERPYPNPIGWNHWRKIDGSRHNIIEAEAFTSGPPHANWIATPSLLKASADDQFARGINRMTIHSCVLQPWAEDVLPGKVMGRWGSHFGRTQTWGLSGKGFFEYLNRCQALLQWGDIGKDRVSGRNIKPAKTHFTSLCRQGRGRNVFFVANHSAHAASIDLALPSKEVSARWFDPVTGKISSVDVIGGVVSMSFAPNASGFLEVVKCTTSPTPSSSPTPTPSPSPSTSTSTSTKLHLTKPFTVTFGERTIQMTELKDWTSFEDPLVRYFSGTAVYRTTFSLDASQTGAERISLGNCNRQVAEVTINGRKIGTLWCEPYEIDLPRGILKSGENELRIDFTNVWANRLIGDEQEKADCEFVPAQFMGGGSHLKRFPDWFKDGISARPSKGRKCFTDWNFFTKDSPLVPSGLLGPIELK